MGGWGGLAGMESARGRTLGEAFADDARLGTGAPAGLRASSKVPHIPQKRKLSELFSPHFGQITMVSEWLSLGLTQESLMPGKSNLRV
jgi:hypothetical protein